MAQVAELVASVLIISDTAFKDPSSDRAESTLNDVFAGNAQGQWRVQESNIVPDDLSAIQRKICHWCDSEPAPNLVVTTGGTGFAIRDHTPEAVNPLIHRHAPGLVHAMLASSLAITPFAMMSRPVAGVRNKTLIITLPGSPKGARENLQAILRLLPHACHQISGLDSRALHAGDAGMLEGQVRTPTTPTASGSHTHAHGHTHTHAHGGHVIPKAHTKPEDRPRSNDPGAGPSNRNRHSPYPIISVEKALASIQQHAPRPAIKRAQVDDLLVGRILAEHVTASEPVPSFRASIVDGYAVSINGDRPSCKGNFVVASISHAAPGETFELKSGQIARITTGAPLPSGSNAVIMVEDTCVHSFTPDGKEEHEIEILTDAIKSGENVREIGSDVKVGTVLLHKDQQITSVGGELGLLASVGRPYVQVYDQPIIGVMSTGNEIVGIDRPGPLRLGEVRDSNRPALLAAVKSWGYEVSDLGITKDEPEALEKQLRNAQSKVNVIITTGGVSMGELDLLKPTIERSLHGTVHFGRVAMKPGKPTTFSTVPSPDATRPPTLIFSLPGNPASALVTAHLFVLPALQKMSGKPPPYGLPRIKAKLAQQTPCDRERREYHRVALDARDDGSIWASTTGGQRSSRIGSMSGAQGLACLPVKDGSLEIGELIDVLMLGNGINGL